jgi:hypothetical protein
MVVAGRRQTWNANDIAEIALITSTIEIYIYSLSTTIEI